MTKASVVSPIHFNDNKTLATEASLLSHSHVVLCFTSMASEQIVCSFH